MRWFLIFGLLYSFLLTAQQPEGSAEAGLESLADSPGDLNQLAEELQYIQSHRIAINFADADELLQIPYLNIFQAGNIILYRSNSGHIYSPYELIHVKGLDRELIERIMPYLDFRTTELHPELDLKNLFRYSRQEVVCRWQQVLQNRAGFSDSIRSPYLGSPSALYGRYRLNYRQHLSMAFTLQQDAGEPVGGPLQASFFDHLSGHIALRDYGRLRQLILGDFQVEYGQGLALWSGLAFGKSARSTDIKRYARGVRPYSGSEENRFFRGLATAYELSDALQLSLFYSRHAQDANLGTVAGADNELIAESLNSTGLHRDKNELTKKHSNLLESFGGNVEFEAERLAVGLNAVGYKLDKPLAAPDRLYQHFSFHGKQLGNFSLDVNYLFSDLNFFGELALDHNGTAAFLTGFQSNPADGVYLSFLHRRIDKAYQHFYIAPFAEAPQSGELGYYLGLEWQLNPIFSLQAYGDLYEHKWARYRVDGPSHGFELFFQLEGTFTRNYTAYLRFQRETDQLNTASEQPINSLSTRQRYRLRLHHDYQISPTLSAANRIEAQHYRHQGDLHRGLLIFQDLKYQKAKLSLKLRLALFDVEDYAARIYAYENDLLYAFSIPAYFGKGRRLYLLAAYQLNAKLQLQARIGHTRYTDRDQISSGKQLINGPRQTEVKLQLRYKF